LNIRTILFLLFIVLFTSLLAGFYPAKVLSSYLPVLSLKRMDGHKNSENGGYGKALSFFSSRYP